MHKVLVSVYSDLDNFESKSIEIENVENAVNFTFTSGEGEEKTLSYGLAVLEVDDQGREWYVNSVSTSYQENTPEYMIENAKRNIKNIFVSKFK